MTFLTELISAKAFFVSIALALCLPTAATASEEEESLRGYFHGEVAVSDAGTAIIGRIEGVTGALEQLIRVKMTDARWAPGIRDGKPVALTVPFTGNVLLEVGDGGDYEVRDLQVRVEPKVMQGPPPMWRPSFLREGLTAHTELRLHIAGDGRVIAVDPVSSSSPSLEREARKTLYKWRFVPLPKGLEAMTVTVPIWFYAGATPPPKPAFSCDRDPGLPALVDQDGCLDLVEITAIRRGSVTL